ncbi:MAG: proton-conducting membrane transporter, partial [Clostridia bacterium]|nr:proton-conducting membrane transporter [Clostridia bacterium]
MLLIKKLNNRNIRIGIITSFEFIQTLFTLWLVFSNEVSSGSFEFTKGFSLGFRSDLTAKLFCLIISGAWLLVTIYATVYMKHEKNEERFFLFSFLTQGAMMGAILSSNLISMYLFFELVTLFSAPLVLHALSKEAISAAKKYLYYSIAGAFLALFGIFVLATNTTTLNFTSGGTVTEVTPLVLTGVFCMCIGFGAKAGLFPLHGWLPTAHPVAPAPASALLSGIIAKIGVLA